MGKRPKLLSREKRKINRQQEKEVGESSNQDQVSGDPPESKVFKHEVFLSFYGEDTRMGFTDQLYRRLKDLRIEPFRDSEKLYVGENIKDKLTEAIKTSKIMMPIFSKNYASSKWCLMELTHMMKWVEMHKDTTLMCPIFYDVTPSEVKKQTGSFQKAFDEHVKEFDEKTVKEWREALGKVPETKGWERIKIGGGYDEDLIQAIATKLQMELKKMHVKVTEHLVGMDQHEAKLMSLLDLDCDDVKIVGIVGMGGIGKTTIARFIYNNLCDHFSQRCSILENVRENVKQSGGLDTLGNKLMSDILKRPLDGVQMDESTFKGTKALIVLDDVGKASQLKEIIGNCNWFGRGSRIIVTTRNNNTFREQKGAKIYEPGVMNDDNALSLFCKHAFRKDFPLDGYEDLSKEIVSKVAGLPLSLVVIGSLLATKEKNVWHEKLKDLGEKMDRRIQRILQVSYDMLDYGHQQIFLDIACHFIESEIDERLAASYMWDDYKFSPVHGIDTLVNLSLVKIDENGRFKMHDQLRDLGREIVRIKENPDNSGKKRITLNPEKRSRLWSPEEALEVLTDKKGTERVETLTLDHSPTKCFSNEVFDRMSGLRYLNLYYMHLTGDFKGIFSNLRWFRWRPDSRITEITNFCLPKLVVLDLSFSEISDGWEDFIQIKRATNLKVLDLSDCRNLTKTPDLSSFSKLERLNLEKSSLAEISPSIGYLHHLKWLDISHSGVKRLPSEIGRLEKLEELEASFCLFLNELPESVGNLQSLRRLHIRNLRVKRLPCEIGRLEKLEELDADGCYCLNELPKSIGNLQSLRRLHIRNLEVKRLPCEIGRLEKLEELDADGCKSLEELPETTGNLRSLRRLCISDSGVKRLPSEIGRLEKLEELDAWFCKSLEELPETTGNLRSLRWLRISNSGVKRLPSEIGMLEKLEKLDVTGCKSLEELPETTGNLRSLRWLRISDSGVKRLPSEIGMLEKLEKLDTTGCKSLEELPETIGNLRSLRWLCISDSGVKRLPSAIGGLEKLEELDASSCISLEGELSSGVWSLSALRELILGNTRISSRVPADISCCSELRDLDLGSCPNIHLPSSELKLPPSLEGLDIPLTKASLDSVARLHKLVCLAFHHCDDTGLVEFPIDLGGLPLELQKSTFKGFNNFASLPVKINNLPWLRVLSIGCNEYHVFEIGLLALDCCEFLERLPDLPDTLEDIRIYNCPKLSDVNGLAGGLSSLVDLYIVNCPSLNSLPDFSTLNGLMHLSIFKCEKVRIIKGLETLARLDRLWLVDCPCLEMLPHYYLESKFSPEDDNGHTLVLKNFGPHNDAWKKNWPGKRFYLPLINQ